MTSALADVAAFALVVTLSPFPIIALVPIVSGRSGVARGWAFLAGWVAGLAVVSFGAFMLLELSGVDPSSGSEPATWATVTRGLLGVLLVAYAARTWLGRPRDGEVAEAPAWLASIDDASTSRIAVTGLAISAVNPKILLLSVAAAAAVVEAEQSTSSSMIALGCYVVVSTIGPAIPVILATAAPSRSAHLLTRLRAWMQRHDPAIMAVLFGVIGAKLIIDTLRTLG